MKREEILTHEFVEYIPDDLKEGTIYVSIEYATVAHKCCCGCGSEVVTPLSPTDWKLTFDGQSISLYPSIGNWNFPCKSHYWIKSNRVKWAPQWSQKEIEDGRSYDQLAKERYFDSTRIVIDGDTRVSAEKSEEDKAEKGLWRKLKSWWLNSILKENG